MDFEIIQEVVRQNKPLLVSVELFRKILEKYRKILRVIT